jgi:hypothetical protein
MLKVLKEITIWMKFSNIKITQALFGKLSIKPYHQKVKKNILIPKTVAD